MTCVEAIDIMGDALDGALPAQVLPEFEEHMVECPSCGEYLGQLRITRDALRSLPRDASTSPHRAELLRRFRERFGDKGPDPS
jgi:anti-sigma factor RsiW